MIHKPCDPNRDESQWLAATPICYVAAAILIDPMARICLTQRMASKQFAGLWEFPGGKIEPNETPEATLVRELQEELGIHTFTSCFWPFTFISHRYNDFHLIMYLYSCRNWSHPPKGNEGQALKWVPKNDLKSNEMPKANASVVSLIKQWL